MRENPVKTLVENCGGYQKTSRLLGVKYQLLQQWSSKGVIPIKRIQQIERVTGIPRHELRPELFEGYVLTSQATETKHSTEEKHEQEASE